MDSRRRTLPWLLSLIIVALGAFWLFSAGGPAGRGAESTRRPLITQPTPTIYPSSVTVIKSVQRLSRLETASYHIEKVITAETGQGPLGFLFGDKLLLIAYGEVIAGIELSEIGPDAILRTDDGTLYMRLPPVEVFVATLDNERTQVYDRQTGMVGLNEQLETEARREAERLILEAALEEGLEAEAEDSAQELLEVFLLALGFEQVIFVDVLPTPMPPTPTPPPTPEPAAAVTISPETV